MYNKNFCSTCGYRLPPGSAFCENCGSPILPNQPKSPCCNQENLDQTTPCPQPSCTQPSSATDISANWYGFLSIWLIVIWAFLNIILAFYCFTGKIYFPHFSSSQLESALDWLYSEYRGLELVTILSGIFSLIFAGGCLYAFPKLKAFQKSGLTFFNLLMKSVIIANIIVLIELILTDAGSAMDLFPYIIFWLNIVPPSVCLIYYQKRKYLFK